MRRVTFALALAAITCTAPAALAQPAPTALPDQAELRAMSPTEFKAFLAGPALRIREGSAEAKLVHPAGPVAPCPEVENKGINAQAQTSPSLFDRVVQVVLVVFGGPR